MSEIFEVIVGRRGAGGQPVGVVQEQLVRADLDEQRRQAGQIGEGGAGHRISRIGAGAGEVVVGADRGRS